MHNIDRKVGEDKYVFTVDPRYVSAMNVPLSKEEVKVIKLLSPFVREHHLNYAYACRRHIEPSRRPI